MDVLQKATKIVHLESSSSALAYVLYTILTVVLYRIFLAPVLHPRLKGIPGPLSARYGNFYAASLAASGNIESRLRKLHARYGPVVRVGENNVHVADPAALPIIYSMGDKYLKGDFYDVFSMYYNDSWFMSVLSTRTPATHRMYMQQTADVNSRTNLRLYKGAFDRSFKKFCRLTAELEGKPIDINMWFKCWAFDVNNAMIFNNEYGFMDARGDVNGVIASLDMGGMILSPMGQLPALNRFMQSKFMMNFMRFATGTKNYRLELMQMIEQMIRACEAEQSEEEDCLYRTLRKSLRNQKAGLDHNHVVVHCADLFIGGAATTRTAIVSIFYHLSKNPKTLAKLNEEIATAVAGLGPDEYISWEKALPLPYLQAVIQESLRILPVTPMPLMRAVPKGGATIGGCFLREGTQVASSAGVMHFNTDIYGADVEAFRPERWIDVEPAKLAKMKSCSLTFGRGEYACKGKQRVMNEMSKFVVELLRRFDIEWAGGEDEQWTVNSGWLSDMPGTMLSFKPKEVVC